MLTDLMYENSFFPKVTKPTRITTKAATVLDHTWTNMLNKKQATGLLVDCIADHLPVLSCIELEKN